MEKTMRVTGRGALSVKPDTIRLSFSLEAQCPGYDEALAACGEKARGLEEAIGPLGFEKEALKTENYGVSAEYENVRDEKGEYTRRFAGYRVHHDLLLSFGADSALLGRVLSAVAACGAVPALSIAYTVKDPEGVKNTLLARAVEDARVKAEHLARAAGVALGEIVLIDYTWGENDIARPMNTLALPAGAAVMAMADRMPEMEPEALSLADSVTVVWSI